jgi:predicted AlkP superfamily pyrophosphatase or phosphodiesterase
VFEQPVRPQYTAASIAGVVPALLHGGPAGWLPSPVAGARAVVLLVLDGLGWNLLQRHGSQAPELLALTGGPITTVVPSTTGAALTSITTGHAPAEHGILGYRIRAGTHILDVLRWTTPDGRPPQAATIAPVAPFAGRRVPVVTRGEFARTGFTEAHMRGARIVGWRTTATLVQHCARLIGDGERFVYAYYDGVDRVAHEFGLDDRYLPAEIAATDGLVGELLDALPGDVAVAITSDHGQVHYEEHVDLEAVAPLVEAYGGDGRFRYLYARPGAAAELHARAKDEYADRAWVFDRDELFDDGWLGPNPPEPSVRRRVGDVVLAARDPVAFKDPTHPAEASLKAGHGSLTEDEMLVPLLSARGRG